MYATAHVGGGRQTEAIKRHAPRQTSFFFKPPISFVGVNRLGFDALVPRSSRSRLAGSRRVEMRWVYDN